METKFPILTHEQADLCGKGLGARCCLFLVMGANGFECARNTELHRTLVSPRPEYTAKRMPILAFPQCQLKAEE